MSDETLDNIDALKTPEKQLILQWVEALAEATHDLKPGAAMGALDAAAEDHKTVVTPISDQLVQNLITGGAFNPSKPDLNQYRLNQDKVLTTVKDGSEQERKRMLTIVTATEKFVHILAGEGWDYLAKGMGLSLVIQHLLQKVASIVDITLTGLDKLPIPPSKLPDRGALDLIGYVEEPGIHREITANPFFTPNPENPQADTGAMEASAKKTALLWTAHNLLVGTWTRFINSYANSKSFGPSENATTVADSLLQRSNFSLNAIFSPGSEDAVPTTNEFKQLMLLHETIKRHKLVNKVTAEEKNSEIAPSDPIETAQQTLNQKIAEVGATQVELEANKAELQGKIAALQEQLLQAQNSATELSTVETALQNLQTRLQAETAKHQQQQTELAIQGQIELGDLTPQTAADLLSASSADLPAGVTTQQAAEYAHTLGQLCSLDEPEEKVFANYLIAISSVNGLNLDKTMKSTMRSAVEQTINSFKLKLDAGRQKIVDHAALTQSPPGLPAELQLVIDEIGKL